MLTFMYVDDKCVLKYFFDTIAIYRLKDNWRGAEKFATHKEVIWDEVFDLSILSLI